MNLHEWYENKIKIPNKFGYSVMNFAASSLGIVKRSIGDIGREIQIKIENVDEPYVKDDTIVFSSNMFSPVASERPNQEADVDTTISACLGVVVHEAAHVRYSAATLPAMIELAESKFDHKLLRIFFNILEDIHIENRIIEEEWWCHWMMESAWEYFLPSSRLDDIVPVSAPATDMETAGDLIRILIMAKNRSSSLYGVYNDFIDEVLDACYAVEDYDDQVDRYKYILEVYLRYFNLDDEELEKEQERMAEMLQELLGFLKGLLDEMKREPEDSFMKADDERTFDEIVESTSAGEIDKYEPGEIPFFEIVPRIVGNPIQPDERYFGFSSLTRQLASRPLPKGVRSKRGNRIVSPRNILLDDKIFRKRMDYKKPLPLEVIILVDCSGSMTSGNNIGKALSAARGAAYGLVNGHHDVAIYGHTGDIYEYGHVNLVLYRFKGFNENISIIEKRMPNDRKDGINLCQNRDGDAIRRVSDKFTRRKNVKLLIVISDGAPEAHGYHGKSAQNDTLMAVKTVREKGIKVLSISINDYATSTNDYIYGKEFNTSNEDSGVVIDVISKVLLSQG